MFSSIWRNMNVFVRVFSFEMVFLFSGAALALCVPTFGAFLFLACWLSVRSSWVGFGLAGSGRAALDQGSFWLFFLVASLAPEMVTWILPKSTKNKWFWDYLCAKSRSQNRCMRAPLFRKQLFSRLFVEFWRAPLGSKWARWCPIGGSIRCF